MDSRWPGVKKRLDNHGFVIRTHITDVDWVGVAARKLYVVEGVTFLHAFFVNSKDIEDQQVWFLPLNLAILKEYCDYAEETWY